MSFVRVQPNGWPVGGGPSLTSAQMNALDSDHAKALDKSTAGDTLSGIVAVASSGGVMFEAGSVFALANAGSVSGSLTIEGELYTNAGGYIQLGGGASDIRLAAYGSRNLSGPCQYINTATGWTLQNYDAIGPATNQVAIIPLLGLHNGATLNTVTVWLYVPNPHNAGVPTVLPAMNVLRKSLATGAETFVSLNSAGATAFPTPASGSAWYNSGNVQSWTWTSNQNNTINTQLYVYYLVLTDENGTNASSGNVYVGYACNLSNISSLALP